MRIGIDARFFGPIGKGLGRYVQKLIENLEKVDKVNQYFIFLKKENFDDYKLNNKNFKKVLADYRWYTFAEQIKFPFLLRKYKLDLVHFPHFNVPVLYFGKFIVTIHDLILIHFPTVRSSTLGPIFYRFKFFIYKAVIKLAIYRSSKVITVSEFTKKDIVKNYPKIDKEKVIVTYESCEDYCMLSPPNKDKEILAKYGIIKPYIMYVGNAYPHKNLERLILAFKQIKIVKKDLRLVLIGKEDYFFKIIKNLVVEEQIKDVIFAGYVPDLELDVIFHNVSAFVWPTLYEGFGLPPLEAMAKGAPVISSDHACMKEILEDSAFYFDGENIDDIRDSVSNVLDNEELKNKLIQKGYKQIAKYSWKKMAKTTLNIYRKIQS